MNNVVQIRNVSRSYMLGGQQVNALKNITLDIEDGVFIAIAGPSGSGKSTLLNLIGCIDTPTSGQILINGQDVSGKTPDELASLRARTIGFIFQTFNLLPVLSAYENVEYPLLQLPEIGKEERARRVKYFLDVVGLEQKKDHRPNQLSGGQRQRVAIARALVTRPDCVLADEPTGNLDRSSADSVFALMLELAQAHDIALVLVTHDASLAARCTRQLQLVAGRLVSVR